MAMKVNSLPSRQQSQAQQAPQEQVAPQEAQAQPAQGGEEGGAVFTPEDTAQIEQTCQQIAKLQEQNPRAGDKLAQELGYAVCEMIIKQQQNAQAEDQGMAEAMGGQPAAPGAEAANSFSTSPDQY